MNASQVLNGSKGELWVNGTYMAEVTAFQATVTIDKADINIAGKLGKFSKVIGYEGKGTIKVNKVSSFFINLMSANIKAGVQTTATIISALNDPGSLGAERISINDAVFDEMSLANWEAKKAGEDSIPFTFTDWDLLDTIADQ
jgi:hypothetical protein